MKGLQARMSRVYAEQVARGAIIDVEKERARFAVPGDTPIYVQVSPEHNAA
jgi:hypothetical protein